MNISLLDSEFSGMDIAFKILGYGVIGLSFLLAFLAFKLLLTEQKQKKPRENLLKSIYIFMGFSTVLCTIGFILEFSSNKTEIKHSNSFVYTGYDSTDINVDLKEFDTLAIYRDTLETNQQKFKKVKEFMENYYRNPDILRQINAGTLYTTKGNAYPFVVDLKFISQLNSDFTIEINNKVFPIPERLKEVLIIEDKSINVNLSCIFTLRLGYKEK
jgi:hypothetical protein